MTAPHLILEELTSIAGPIPIVDVNAICPDLLWSCAWEMLATLMKMSTSPPSASASLESRFFAMLNRVVEPRVRAGWGSPAFSPGGFVVLETKNVRTGRRARVPLAALRLGKHVLVSTFRGGRSQWVKNLRAHPEARYWMHGRPRPASAVVISGAESERSGRRLPVALRPLLPLLAPYTCAGWAFALLTPEERRGRARVSGCYGTPGPGRREGLSRTAAGGS